jgi:hypothetical protein
MFHLVYKITNTVNGHYYIGVHSTRNIDDGYMGSGKLMRAALKKYGIERFKREILHSFDNRGAALDKEFELVNIDKLNDSSCYNLIIGGLGVRCKPAYAVKSPRNIKHIITLVSAQPGDFKENLLAWAKENTTAFYRSFFKLIPQKLL